MRLPRPSHRRDRDRSLGQSLVEFAIVLPIILFLTLIALDFGRVYLGWINIQSMSRIAANTAANNPRAWADGDTAVQAKYQNQIRNDAAATNCELPKVGGVQTAPAPAFSDTGGNGKADDIGDNASVSLTCTFHLITPGISSILGGTVAVSSSSVFPVKTGMTDPGAGGGAPGVAPNAAFTGNSAISPSSISGVVPFSVQFRDTSGGNPTGWLWVFNDGSPNSVAQDPPLHTFTVAGTYVVTMTASNSYGSSTASMGVTVTPASTVDFTSNTQSGNAPLTVNFTDASSPGGSNYSWTFGTGEGSGSGTTASHTYNSPGTYTVTHTVRYSGVDTTVTKTNYISVSVGLCTVPHLDGVKRNSAQGVWTAAGFTGTVSDGPGHPGGNYTIKSQSLTATSQVPCTSSVVVNNP